jgi:aminocarboxymuconate-semialdehyde decarboxylase
VTRVIDVHAHFVPPGAVRTRSTGELWHGTTVEDDGSGRPVLITGDYRVGLGSRLHWGGPEERLPALAAAGVDLQIVSLIPPLFRYYIDAKDGIAAAREVNDELHRWVTTWPDIYLGLATLPLQDVDASVAELDRAMNELGLVGAAVGTHVDGENWDAPHLLPVLQAAEEMGALVFVHPAGSRVGGALPRYHMRNFIGNPFETTVAIGSLIFGGVLDKVPDLKIVFAHGGGFACADIGRFDHGYHVRPEASEHPQHAPSDYLKRLFFDSLTHSEAALRFLIDTTGIGQVVLGTDYPADMGVARPKEWISSCTSLTDAEKAAILGENLARLVPLPSP